MRLFYLSLLCLLIGCFTERSSSSEVAETAQQQLYFSDCRASSTLDSLTVCENGIEKKNGMEKCVHSAQHRDYIYISNEQPQTGTNYNWFIGIFEGQMQIEAVNYKTRTEAALKYYCRMCGFDILFKARSLDKDDPFIKCYTYDLGYFVEKRIECAAIATAIKMVNTRTTATEFPQFLEVCELTAFGFKLNNDDKLQKITFSSCKSSKTYDKTTVCQNAIDRQFTDCVWYQKLYVSALQGDELNEHWFIGMFKDLVLLDTILYQPRIEKYSLEHCRMCDFELLYADPYFKEDEAFSLCNRITSKVPFKQKFIKCQHTTDAIKFINKRVTTQNNEQYLEICELTAYGVMLEDSLNTVKFDSCSSSTTYNKETVCENAIDRKYGECISLANVFVSALQGTESNNWFIGRFDHLVQLDRLLYHPRVEEYSMTHCRMCEFDVMFSDPSAGDIELFSVCSRVKTKLAFKRRLIICPCVTRAVMIVNRRLKSQNGFQYLEICELTAIGVKFGPKPMRASSPMRATSLHATKENKNVNILQDTI